MTGEKRGLKTGNFMLCRWERDAEDSGSENLLPVRLGKSGTWDVFWPTRKDNVLASELSDGEAAMSKGLG